MGSSGSKYEREQQAAWRDVCAKKVPPYEQAATLGKSQPHFRDLYLSGYGANGVTCCPDTNWPDRYMVRIAASDLLDMQARFTVDRLRCNGLAGQALNEVFNVYAQAPNAQLKEMHFIRCETDLVDGRLFGAMLESQHVRSHVNTVSDTEGVLRMTHTRGLGHDAKSHCLYFVEGDLVHEQVSVRSHNSADGPAEFDYLPMQDGTGAPAVHMEKKNWTNLKKGEQPPFRLYYPDLQVEIVGNKVRITPDTRWNSWITVWPSRVSNYMQYVDAQAVTIWCRKNSAKTSATLRDLINNLAVSQSLTKATRFTFTGGDFHLVSMVQFADFLEARKHNLDWIGFDTGCVNVQPMREALNAVYQEDKVRPYSEQLVMA